jgi:ankyrin repeat protein
MDPELPEKTFIDPENSNVFTYPAIFAAQIAARRDSSDALEVMQLLLKGIDHKKVKDSQGRTPLHLSVTGCSTLATKWLLSEGFETDALDNNGRAPIHNCATSITLEILLDAGAKLNRADKLGFTPLHLAALQGFEDLVERLIFRDADLTAWGKIGSPLHCAVLKQSWRIAAFLLKADDGKKNKIEINAVDEHGDTALHIAARLARPDLLQLLFAHHIDTLIKNKRGFTAKSQFEDLAIKEETEDLFGSRRKSAGSLDSDSKEQETEAAEEKDTKTPRAWRSSSNPHGIGRTNENKRSPFLGDREQAGEMDFHRSSDSESESGSDEATLSNPNDNGNDEAIAQTAPFSTSTSQEANRECLRAYEKAMKAYQDDIWKRAKHNPGTLLTHFQQPLSPPERGKPPPAFDFLERGPEGS